MKNNFWTKLSVSIIGIILSLVSYILIIIFDSKLNLSNAQSIASMPAFYVSVIILIITQTINITIESHQSYKIKEIVDKHDKKISNAIKDNLSVLPIGNSKIAVNYVKENLDEIDRVLNTSFTMDIEEELADSDLYSTQEYNKFRNVIYSFIKKGGTWHDIGDNHSIGDFRKTAETIKKSGISNKTNYQYKLIINGLSQINFIILFYKTGLSEVLFNWDYKTTGQTPTILLSREHDIVQMFVSHYEYLWKSASNDSENILTS